MLTTPNLWNFQSVLHTLAAIQEFSRNTVSTREEARESRPHPEEPGFPLLAREESSFPCVVGKEFEGFPSQLKTRCSPQERQRTPGSCHHSQSPTDVSVHSRETCFPCTASTFKPRIDSHHGGTWDIPVGKPSGKASRESHRSLDHGKVSATLLLQLGRKAHVHAPTRDED